MGPTQDTIQRVVVASANLAYQRMIQGFLTLAWADPHSGEVELKIIPVRRNDPVMVYDGVRYDVRTISVAKALYVLHTGKPTGEAPMEELAEWQPPWQGGIPCSAHNLWGVAMAFSGDKEVVDRQFCLDVERDSRRTQGEILAEIMEVETDNRKAYGLDEYMDVSTSARLEELKAELIDRQEADVNFFFDSHIRLRG